MGKLVKDVNVELGRPMIANGWTLHHYRTFEAALRLTETEPENAPAPERAARTQDRPGASCEGLCSYKRLACVPISVVVLK